MVYYKDKKRLRIAIYWIVGGVLIGAIVGLITISAWLSYFRGELDWPISELLLFSCGLLVPLLLLLSGCRVCPVIVAQPDGLTIRTCVFLNFFVPWEDIVDLWEYNSWSVVDRMLGGYHTTMVRIKRGLTPIHRSVPKKEADRWHWRRGFEFSSAGVAYGELVRIIEEHVGSKQV
jgi:MFS family permease